MTENNFQISYKLNGKEMPVINAIFPIADQVSPFGYRMFAVEQIYLANIDVFGESNPLDTEITDQPIVFGEPTQIATVHQVLDRMGVTDALYIFEGVATPL